MHSYLDPKYSTHPSMWERVKAAFHGAQHHPAAPTQPEPIRYSPSDDFGHPTAGPVRRPDEKIRFEGYAQIAKRAQDERVADQAKVSLRDAASQPGAEPKT